MRFFSYLIFVSTVLSCEESKKIDMPLKKATIQKETTVKQLDLNATGNFSFQLTDLQLFYTIKLDQKVNSVLKMKL